MADPYGFQSDDYHAVRQIARHFFGNSAQFRIEPILSYNNRVARVRIAGRGDRIIKMALRGRRESPMLREPQVMSVLRQSGLPVPNVEFDDLSGQIAGRPAFVMNSAGERTGNDLAGLSQHNRRTLYRNIGKLLAGFHSLPFSSPADFDGQTLVTADFERTPLEAWHHKQLRYLTTHGLLPADEIARLVAGIETLPPARSYALCHGDFNPSQCVRIGPRVAAVVDWEGSYVGDPLFDFAVYDVLLEIATSQELAAQSRDAYAKLRPLPEDYEQSMAPFKMVHAASMMATFHAGRRDGPLRAARGAYQRLRRASIEAEAA